MTEQKNSMECIIDNNYVYLFSLDEDGPEGFMIPYSEWDFLTKAVEQKRKNLLEWVMFGFDECSFCDEAKKFLEEREEAFVYNNIKSNEEFKSLLKTLVPEAKTVPQIFVEENYVGGYIDFEKYVGENYGERNSN